MTTTTLRKIYAFDVAPGQKKSIYSMVSTWTLKKTKIYILISESAFLLFEAFFIFFYS